MNDYELNGRRLRVNFSNSSHLEVLANKLGMDLSHQQSHRPGGGGGGAAASSSASRVPVRTSPDVAFVVGGVPLPFAPGEVWYADFDRIHHVHNPGLAPRVHLVLDCVVNPSSMPWRREYM